MIFNNPIIRGYHPDPSICKANGKYYLVTSSFQYFPGVSLFESKDLINWEQIGYCLTRQSQLDLRTVHSSCGIFAPTIRFYQGRFYMTTTNVGSPNGSNFYVWTDDIYGEWSDPVWVDQGGIDPSLYFEEGRAYFMSNGVDQNGASAILQCEIDINTGKKLSESKPVWNGTGGRYLESPHLYKINGYYYIMAAEGGTEYGHMVTYARSENLWGPFESYPKNPVLTNRNLGGYQIQGVGHADLIEDDNGNWWLFHLGFRQISQWLPFHHLGRETFLMPVDFKDGWFMVGHNGTTTQVVETNRIPSSVKQIFKKEYTFQNTEWNKDWRFLRIIDRDKYVFEKNELKIRRSKDTLDTCGCPSFVGLHQKEFDMDLSVNVTVNDGEAGITLYMDENHHYDLAIIKENDDYNVVLKLNVGDIKHIQQSVKVKSNSVSLRITSNAEYYEFYYIEDEKEIKLGKAQTRYLSSEVACGFTGVVMGLYSQYGTGKDFNKFIDFVCRYN